MERFYNIHRTKAASETHFYVGVYEEKYPLCTGPKFQLSERALSTLWNAGRTSFSLLSLLPYVCQVMKNILAAMKVQYVFSGNVQHCIGIQTFIKLCPHSGRSF